MLANFNIGRSLVLVARVASWLMRLVTCLSWVRCLALAALNVGGGSAVSLQLSLALAQCDLYHWSVVVTVNERPALHACGPTHVRSLVVFENLPLLLLRAVECLILLFELGIGVARRGHLEVPVLNYVPVDVGEEGVELDLSGSSCTRSKTFAGVAVEQMHDQVFGLLRHAYWQLEDTTLDVVEQLVPA